MTFRRRVPALLLAFVVLALAAACNQQSGDLGSRQGNVRITLTGGTVSTATATGVSTSTAINDGGFMDGGDILSRLSEVNVTFSSLLARNMEGDLIDLSIDLPTTVNLLTLMNGNQITLPMGTLPPGMYDQLVVVITHVQFVLVDGMKVDLTPPGGGWTRIIPVTPFEVVEGQTVTIELRFNPQHAFGESDGEFEFYPDFDCGRD